MGRLAQTALQRKAYEDQQKRLQPTPPANGDTRTGASKFFDTVNPLDDGRSWTTQKPTTKKSTVDQAKDALTSVGNSIASPFKRLGAGGAEVLNEVTGNADKEQQNYDAAQESQSKLLIDTYKQIKSETDPKKKARLQKQADSIQADLKDSYQKRTGRIKETIDRTDPVKAAAAVGEVGLDIATAGTGGAAVQGGKMAAKQAAKEAAKEAAQKGGRMAAKQIAKTAGTTGAQGAAGGALSAVEQKGKDVTLKDMATSALAGTVTGAAFGGATAGIGQVLKNLPKGQGGFVKNPFYKAEIGDDLANEIKNGHVKGDIVEHPTESLKLGSDTVSDELDRGAVDAYKAKLQAGEPLDPIIVTKGQDGTPYIQDGAHRYAAAQELGIENIPTVEKANNVVMAEKVTPPTEASLTAKVERPSKPVTAYHGSTNDGLTSLVPGAKTGLNEKRNLLYLTEDESAAMDYTKVRGTDGNGLGELSDSKTGKVYQTQVEGNILGAYDREALDALKAAPGYENLSVKTKNQLTNDTGLSPEILESNDELTGFLKDNGITAVRAHLPNTQSSQLVVVNPDNVSITPKDPPVQLKVLDDVQREADARTPGGTETPASQVTETKTQKGAQYLVDDIDKLQKETGIDLTPIDRQAAAALTGEVRRSAFQEFRDKMGRNFQDTLTYAARSLGKNGTDFVYGMLQGNKFKRDALTAMRDNMNQISKLNKKLTGSSLTAKRDVGARIGQALDDRANAGNYLKTDAEKELFNHYVQVFDYVKTLREKAGLETLENYRPWVSMKEASEPPTWLAENVTNKRTTTLSRYSKERTRTTPSDDVDNNLADMIYGYVNSQLNEMAYDAPVRRFKGSIDTMNSGNKANVGQMNEGIDYMRELVNQAVNPARKNVVERAAGKLTSNVYGAVLPFNVRLAIQNKAQRFVANSRVSKGAVKLVKQLDDADAKELEKGMVFGDSTVYGQLEDVNPSAPVKKGLGQKMAKVDPYQKSEHSNVITSYHKGAMQAVMDSEPYKAAKANGMSSKEAIHAALQDPDVKELAMRRGNVVVNDTQFGASPLARPEMLREEGSLWGVIPKKTIYMFTRFPIGMSQHALETLNNKSSRALEMLKNGDPRAVSISEMRTNYHALLDSMKDAQKAVDNGTDVGIPKEVLSKQIETVKKNLKIIDTEGKKVSQIRGHKTTKNLAKMWLAAATIQVIFDGGIQSFADDPVSTSADALAKTNPTMGNRVVGEYSPLAAITSSASPIDRYGRPNTRAIANYVPGVGLAVNRGRDVQKIFKSLTGSGEDQ